LAATPGLSYPKKIISKWLAPLLIVIELDQEEMRLRCEHPPLLPPSVRR
jgi:hypothetical protein